MTNQQGRIKASREIRTTYSPFDWFFYRRVNTKQENSSHSGRLPQENPAPGFSLRPYVSVHLNQTRGMSSSECSVPINIMNREREKTHSSGADPGFLESGVRCIKGGGGRGSLC